MIFFWFNKTSLTLTTIYENFVYCLNLSTSELSNWKVCKARKLWCGRPMQKIISSINGVQAGLFHLQSFCERTEMRKIILLSIFLVILAAIYVSKPRTLGWDENDYILHFQCDAQNRQSSPKTQNGVNGFGTSKPSTSLRQTAGNTPIRQKHKLKSNQRATRLSQQNYNNSNSSESHQRGWSSCEFSFFQHDLILLLNFLSLTSLLTQQ